MAVEISASACHDSSPSPFSRASLRSTRLFFKSFKGHRGWTRSSPPADRPFRYRGSGALLRGLSKEQVPILTAVDRARNHFDLVLERREKQPSCEVSNPASSQGSVICSNGFDAYRELAQRTRSDHHVVEFTKPNQKRKARGLPRGRAL